MYRSRSCSKTSWSCWNFRERVINHLLLCLLLLLLLLLLFRVFYLRLYGLLEVLLLPCKISLKETSLSIVQLTTALRCQSSSKSWSLNLHQMNVVSWLSRSSWTRSGITLAPVTTAASTLVNRLHLAKLSAGQVTLPEIKFLFWFFKRRIDRRRGGEM